MWHQGEARSSVTRRLRRGPVAAPERGRHRTDLCPRAASRQPGAVRPLRMWGARGVRCVAAAGSDVAVRGCCLADAHRIAARCGICSLERYDEGPTLTPGVPDTEGCDAIGDRVVGCPRAVGSKTFGTHARGPLDGRPIYGPTLGRGARDDRVRDPCPADLRSGRGADPRLRHTVRAGPPRLSRGATWRPANDEPGRWFGACHPPSAALPRSARGRGRQLNVGLSCTNDIHDTQHLGNVGHVERHGIGDRHHDHRRRCLRRRRYGQPGSRRLWRHRCSGRLRGRLGKFGPGGSGRRGLTEPAGRSGSIS